MSDLSLQLQRAIGQLPVSSYFDATLFEREREALLALALDTMEPACLSCARCVDLDFGVQAQTPDQMCWKHLEQYTQLAGGP